jgi:hypothetical protein
MTLGAAAILLCGLAAGQKEQKPAELQLTNDGKMLRPANYREWVWLSSGIGMSYQPGASASEHPVFDNVFASPSAYRVFAATGKWPSGTVLVLEIRASQSNASINKSGHFQGDLEGIEVHVKDDRIPGGWGFYGFGKDKSSATLIPKTASCYSCHEQHGAVDTTFVQFYPTLLEVARAKNVLRANY